MGDSEQLGKKIVSKEKKKENEQSEGRVDGRNDWMSHASIFSRAVAYQVLHNPLIRDSRDRLLIPRLPHDTRAVEVSCLIFVFLVIL